MWMLEIGVGLILAAVLFVALKILGLMIKVAFIAAVIGFLVGVVGARLLRSRGS